MPKLISLLLILCPLLAGVQLPKFSRQVLGNGVVIAVMPKRDVPLVSVRVLIRGGAESDPPELSGLASVTVEALRRGTSTRTADQFSEELDFLGATFTAHADPQASVVTMEFLSKDLDKGLELLANALAQPTFPADAVAKLLSERIDGAKEIKDNPSAAASAYFQSFYYGANHPYGRPADETTLGRIKREHVQDYYRRMYAGRNMVVALVGNVDEKAAEKKLTSVLSKVAAGERYVWQQVSAPLATGPRLALIDKPDATQTNFLIGAPGISRTNPDRVPLTLVNTVFGGRFTSMLNDELRVNSGLTYGAGSRLDQNHLPGRITIASFTRTETTEKAIDLALDVLKRLQKNGINAEQLASAKAYVKGTYPSEHLETSDQLAQILTELELFDLHRSEVDDLFSSIDAVTLETANAIARKYYKPENLTFLLLGNPATFAANLHHYAKSIVRVPLSAPGLSLAPHPSGAGPSQ